jgi:hypothetical protein
MGPFVDCTSNQVCCTLRTLHFWKSRLTCTQAIAYMELLKPKHKSLIQDSLSKAKELSSTFDEIPETELAVEIAVRSFDFGKT